MMETENSRANPDTQFDVDIMILDYLVCTAVNATLKARIAERHGQAHSWDVEGLLLLFDSRCHSSSEFSLRASLRSQLT